MRPRRAEHGAALLFAMLVVAMVATVSTASLWKQWRGVEVEAAERARVQSRWLVTGALDWARLLLREDARAGSIDHLGEPWALPLEEARLTTFMAGPGGGIEADAPDDVGGTFLSGHITDMQSRLNVANLAGLGQVSEPSLRAFTRLFALLGLPPEELAQLTENMRRVSDQGVEGAARAQTPVGPQRADELASFGLSPGTMLLLAPHVTVLPARTPVNLNTAGAEVIYSVVDGINMADARRLVAERGTSPVRTLAEAAKVLGLAEGSLADNAVYSVSTRFFEVRARLRVEHAVVEEAALMQRDGLDVVLMRRERGANRLP